MATLSNREAVALGSVLVMRVAEVSGARVLIIKGISNEIHALGGARTSVDVDCLVHPADLESFLAAAIDIGWTEHRSPNAFRVSPPHSTVLKHASWPLELDVHWRFPGFLKIPSATFDVLWESSERVAWAGAHVRIPSIAACLLINAAHALRDPRSSSEKLRQAREDIAADPTRWPTLVSLCAALEGTFTLSALEVAPFKAWAQKPANSIELEWWRRTRREDARPIGWLMAIKSARSLSDVLRLIKAARMRARREIGEETGGPLKRSVVRARSVRVLAQELIAAWAVLRRTKGAARDVRWMDDPRNISK